MEKFYFTVRIYAHKSTNEWGSDKAERTIDLAATSPVCLSVALAAQVKAEVEDMLEEIIKADEEANKEVTE
jgi:hypothetical protein